MGLRPFLNGLYAFGALLGGCCLILIVLLVIIQVGGRWLGMPFAGIPELSGYAMANSLLLPSGYAFRHGAHIRITLLIERLTGRFHWFVEFLCLCIGLTIAVIFAYHIGHMAYFSHLIRELSQGADATPLWIPQSGMAVGAVILAVAVCDQLVSHFRILLNTFSQPRPAPQAS